MLISSTDPFVLCFALVYVAYLSGKESVEVSAVRGRGACAGSALGWGRGARVYRNTGLELREESLEDTFFAGDLRAGSAGGFSLG